MAISPEHSGCHRIVPVDFNSPYYVDQDPPDLFSLEELFEIAKIDISDGQFLDVLKIDCENCEIDVLNGCEIDTLKHIRQIVGEFHDGYENFMSGLGKKLKTLGFEVTGQTDPLAHATFYAELK